MTTGQTKEKPRVALVTNMLPPYRIGFYNELAGHLDLTVILDTMSEFNRSWSSAQEHAIRFKIEVQNCRSFVYTRHRADVQYEERRQFHFSERTYPSLRRIKPQVIVAAEFGFRSLWSMLYGSLHRVPVLLASEGTPHTEGHVGLVKRMVRRLIVSRSERFWSNGPEASALLVSYGAGRFRIDEGMTGIDTAEWRAEVGRWRERRDATRAELGLRGRVLLFSGSLSERKGVKQLMKATEALAGRPGLPAFSLLLLGDGEHRQWLVQWCQDNPGIRVVMPGFVQHRELSRFFAAADWAVLPTLDDNWPLATLETLVAGLPQLFSVYNGATTDLCSGGTGISFDPLDEAGFAKALEDALRSPLARVEEAEVERIADYYSAAAQAERGAASVGRVLDRGSRDP